MIVGPRQIYRNLVERDHFSFRDADLCLFRARYFNTSAKGGELKMPTCCDPWLTVPQKESLVIISKISGDWGTDLNRVVRT